MYTLSPSTIRSAGPPFPEIVTPCSTTTFFPMTTSRATIRFRSSSPRMGLCPFLASSIPAPLGLLEGGSEPSSRCVHAEPIRHDLPPPRASRLPPGDLQRGLLERSGEGARF